MTPTVGRIVIYRQPGNEIPLNGTQEHPAIITRVWTETMVNLQVFFDDHDPEAIASVRLLPPALPQTSFDFESTGGWFWPVRS